MRSSVMVSRGSALQWPLGSTGYEVDWPEILPLPWRTDSVSLPLESGLGHETTLSSGTFIIKHDAQAGKVLMYWGMLTCSFWNLKPSCECDRASQLEDKRPHEGESRLPGWQPAHCQSCEQGHPRSSSHEISRHRREPLNFVLGARTLLDSP